MKTDRITTQVVEIESEHGYKAKRIRTSDGKSSIEIRTPNGDLIVDFHNGVGGRGEIGDEYEQRAFEVANLLDVIASDPCAVPSMS